MATCSPQRYLANDRNAVRDATLTPSSVLPVDDSVLEVPVSRVGTGQVLLSGSYAGAEAAVIDVEILDNTISVPLISAPVFTGAGSGQLSAIASTGTAQTYTLQLQNTGLPTLSAGVDFEGVRIIARAIGAAGNGITIDIEQTTLDFTQQGFSLLQDLKAGDGGDTTGVKGAAFDWDTKVIGVDNVIPLTAHRVTFGDDKANIYLQYKQYVDGDWVYHFVPAIKADVPKGARVSYVTGGRTVTVTPLVGSPETFSDIVTVYDLLNIFFTTSAIVSVLGVIANDRSPTGQASKELAIRTDAHCEQSTGTGSAAATGFVDAFANANASTELIVATCFAVTSTDHPLARLGAERWKLKGSVSGDATDDVITGLPYTDPAGKFGLTIPQRLPDGYGVQRGRFSIVDIEFIPRDDDLIPDVCPVALTLGTEAVDQGITLIWTKRPAGDCVCSGMPIPDIGGPCLGIFGTGGDGMGYATDTVTRLSDFRTWAADSIASLTAMDADAAYAGSIGAREATVLSDPRGRVDTGENSVSNTIHWHPKRFQEIVSDFESAIALIDVVTDTTFRSNGMSTWDDAVTELKADVTDLIAGSPRLSLRDDLYTARLNSALSAAGISLVGKTDANILESGDGCWRDLGGDYWTVAGSLKGKYAPCFNNTVYYSCRLSSDGKAYFSTREFGFQINIRPECVSKLVYGDKIDLTIGDAAWGSTYAVGDVLTLPIIAAQPQTLAGGQDGNSNLNFYVSGSVDGPLPLFTYDPNASPPGDYNQSGLAFTYTPGGIPNEAGDKWTFDVEGGHWRYRLNGGAWLASSPTDDIDDTPAAFIDGLSIQFQTGAAPSFEVGDIYTFNVAQPYAVSNLQNPDRFAWKWNEAAPNIVADFGSALPVSMVAIARHSIPEGATVTIETGTAPGIYTFTDVLIWSADVIAKEFAEQTARYLRVSLTGATDGGMGWLFAGVALQTTLSAEIDLRRVYKIESNNSGLDQGGNYLGRARSGTIVYTEAALTETDVDGIAAMLDWVKTHGDEACVIIPQISRPDEAFAALIAVDDVAFTELSGYNRDAAYERRYSIQLPFAGAWR